MKTSAFTIRRLLAVGFVAMLLLPVAQMQWKLVKEHRLGGVETPRAQTVVSLATWFDGSLAAQLNDQLSRGIGFRALSVRSMNQVKYACGKYLQDQSINGVLVAKDNWLFETTYVNDYCRPATVGDASEVAKIAARLRQLQDQLASQGKTFLLVITPSKAELYPEYLPDDIVARRKQLSEPRYCDEFRNQLHAQGVHVVDAPRILQSQKSSTPELFSRTGTHWNYLGCFLVWQEILKAVNRHGHDQFPIPALAKVQYDSPRGTDNDIGNLLNLVRIPGGLPQVPYPVVDAKPLPIAQRPRVLFVGTSFTWTIVSTAISTQSVQMCDALYYYQSVYRFTAAQTPLEPGHTARPESVTPIPPGSLDWHSVLLDKDVVIVEFLETQTCDFDWGFCADALAALDNRSLETPDGVQTAHVPATTKR